MSVKSVLQKIASIFQSSDAGSALISIAETDAQKLVAYLKTTTVGTAVIAAVKDVESQNLSGAEKFAHVVADMLPVTLAYLTRSGATTAQLQGIEDVVRELVQSTYNDVLSEMRSLAARLLAIFGIA